MEGITFGVEIQVLVRPKLEKADSARELEAEGWIRESLLSNQERKTNIELLRWIFAGILFFSFFLLSSLTSTCNSYGYYRPLPRNLSAAGIPTHT